MHIDTLKIFCDLAELLSFSRTAEKHFLSQSAVSQQLAQLELIHKVQLLDRKKRPLELTSAGQLFYDASKEMVERYEIERRLEMATVHIEGKSSGQIVEEAVRKIKTGAYLDVFALARRGRERIESAAVVVVATTLSAGEDLHRQ